jgi:hypothetical protein
LLWLAANVKTKFSRNFLCLKQLLSKHLQFFFELKSSLNFPLSSFRKMQRFEFKVIASKRIPENNFFYCETRKKYNKDLIFSWTNVVQFEVKALIRFPVVVNCNLLRRKIPFNESWKSTVTRKNTSKRCWREGKPKFHKNK